MLGCEMDGVLASGPADPTAAGEYHLPKALQVL